MRTIGIIANPASGKDIRRLVSHATVIDNNEKVNIVERIILGAQRFGVDKVIIMPDSFRIGDKVLDRLTVSKELELEMEVLDMMVLRKPLDTEEAARQMEELKVGCVVVLGGDGTNRLVAKHLKSVPMIGVSTGTNNAYPEMIEGTVVGMAAAAIASGFVSTEKVTYRDKVIEIHRNGEPVDIALIDVVVSDEIFVGAKAIWDVAHIKEIIVSRSHPASIGFSSIVGVNQVVDETDDFGARLATDGGPNRFLAPLSAGTVVPIEAGAVEILSLGEWHEWRSPFRGTLAVDGEREVTIAPDDQIAVRIVRNGPIHVDVRKTLEVAMASGFFHQDQDWEALSSKKRKRPSI